MNKLIKIGALLTFIFGLFTLVAQELQEGFEMELVSDDLIAPGGITHGPNGLQYVWDLSGSIWVFENGIKDEVPIINIYDEVAYYGDLGLSGFALDPNFLNNGYVYLLYAVDKYYIDNFGEPDYDPDSSEPYTAQIGRVTRYQLDVSDLRTLIPGSRTILLGEDVDSAIVLPSVTHGTGSLVFGRDGSLMISAGEGTTWVDHHTGGSPRPEFAYDQIALDEGLMQPFEDVGSFRSQMLESLGGKLLRIDPVTGEGLPSNPYFDPEDPNSDRSKVWALGFRNPYRFTLKPNTGSINMNDGDPGVFMIGDVGLTKWEELNICDSPGQNFGWPRYEGMELQPGYVPKPTPHNLKDNPLYNGTNCQVEHYRFRDLIQQPNASHSNFFGNPCDGFEEINDVETFVHVLPTLAWMNEVNTASSTTLVPGYDSDGDAVGDPISSVSTDIDEFEGLASIGGDFYNSVSFPEEYFGAYFHGDFSGWIKTFHFDENNELIDIKPFLGNFPGVSSLTINPYDGCIYFIRVYSEKIYKICYSENLMPIAEATSDIYYGPSPLTVQFDGSASFDPDNDPITFEWDFGDNTSSPEENPEHTFIAASNEPEMFEVELSVTDTAGNVGSKSMIISLNNTPPEVEITSFNEGDLYPLSESFILPLEALVIDAEHSDEELTYTWQTFFHHNTHYHPQPIDNSITTSTFIQPVPCEENIPYFYRIRLTVEDPAGLVGQDERSIFPDCSDTIPLPTVEGYILYPNPGVDYLTLKGDFGLDPVRLAIFNNIGQKLAEQVILPENKKNIPIEIFQLRSGMYILRIDEKDTRKSIRFVKIDL